MAVEKQHALLRCVIRPSAEQEEKFKSFIKKESGLSENAEVDLEIRIDPSISGGFILDFGSSEYDWSTRGREKQLEGAIDDARHRAADEDDGSGDGSDRLMTMLKTAIENFHIAAEKSEVGVVETAGDGIVTINGLNHVMYGEILLFENGVKGMVQNIAEEGVGAILFESEGTIGEGTKVVGTGKKAGLTVSEDYLGRVVDALGTPIDGKEDIKGSEYRPIEEPAPGIIDRQPVTTPMETGILAIDSMFPIGRGQRELIIGDRQTGKTSIALDTILNQKGKNTICIYVAIGQKASTIASLVHTLKENDALSYSVVVCSTAADPAPLQYIAPYSATSLAEFFMHEGKDVLIVYDDLSKHAVAYRTISLLLGRSPGREAYPGDVFYLHSRLLERSARLSKRLGGGSITALPIIETQDGDVSAYIPTNVISITDGQIFLESDLFFEGQRPAVNVGLSVSRVGGAAQTKAMKKAAGSLRIDLAQYREMAVFTQFSSDLDEATKAQLSQGQVLMELLKQPLGHPLSMEDQVILLVVSGNKRFIDIPVKEVKEYESGLLEYIHTEQPDLLAVIRDTGRLEPESTDRILALEAEYRKQYDSNKSASGNNVTDTTAAEQTDAQTGTQK